MDRPGMPTMPMDGGDGGTTCKCPNCGQDIKLTLAKAEPIMPSKPSGMPSMGAPDEAGSDTADMIDQATSRG